MTIILGKAHLKCPLTGEEVVLHKDCMNKDGKGNSCPFFKHFCIQGNKVWIACKKTPKRFSK